MAGGLVQPKSAGELDFLWNNLTHEYRAWTGYAKIRVECGKACPQKTKLLGNSTYYGSIYDFKKMPGNLWDQGQPQFGLDSPGESCVVLQYPSFHDYPCVYDLSAICQYSPEDYVSFVKRRGKKLFG